MCFPSPGPRCSAHAHAEYLTALGRFKRAKTVEEQVRLGAVLEDKQRVYETTPRGLNGLRREADLTQDASMQFILRRRFEAGSAARKSQLAQYNAQQRSKSTAVRETLQEQGIGGRYQLAAGIAYAHLAAQYGAEQVELLDVHTAVAQVAGDERRFFVLPQKYQDFWGEVNHLGDKWLSQDAELTAFLAAQHGHLEHLATANLPALESWFAQRLRASDYAEVLAVDTRSERVEQLAIAQLGERYAINLSLREKRGGTTAWAGAESNLKALLAGTPYAAGAVRKEGREYVISGVAQQLRRDLHVGDNLYMAWRADTADFAVRRAHASSKYAVVVKLALKAALA